MMRSYSSFALVAEVNEQAKAKAGGFQVVMDLGTMLVGHLGDSLDLDDDLAEAEEVGVVVPFQGPPFVGEFKFGLWLEGDASQSQLDLQTFLVDCFQKATTSVLVHFEA